MKKIYILISLIFTISSCVDSVENKPKFQLDKQGEIDLSNAVNTKILLAELNTNFTFNGEIVNPKLIAEFFPPINSDEPAIMSINLSGVNNSNKYYLANSIKKEKDSTIEYVEKIENTYETIGYKWLGKLNNNVHVLSCFWNGGGSGIFSSLVFVNFTPAIFKNNGEIINQININCQGVYSLGDRSSTKIKLNKIKNKVVLENQLFQTDKVESFEIKF